MDLGFHGEVADFYQRYRRGYPPPVIDALVEAFGLTREDVVVDLGCGTGQLTLPLAGRVRGVAGVDPEPDMLRRARQTAADAGVANVTWMVGADTDLPALGRLLGGQSVAAVTIGQALHWMNDGEVFRAAARLARPGGGVAVVTNGTPIWLQDTGWSRALRQWLDHWLGHGTGNPCGTDEASQQRYAGGLAAAGYRVTRASVSYDDELTLDEVTGGIYSALGASQLPPPDQRPQVAAQIRDALAGHAPYAEHVEVSLVLGTVSAAAGG
jgi:SAM-dependent methyltransferase